MARSEITMAVIDDDYVDLSFYGKKLGFNADTLFTRELWDTYIDFDDSEFLEETDGSAMGRIYDIFVGFYNALSAANDLKTTENIKYSVSLVTAPSRKEEVHLECMLEIDGEEDKTLIIVLAGQN